MENDEKTIQASKTKTLVAIAISLGFVALGVSFLSLDVAEIESKQRFNSPFLIYAVGIASLSFFGLGAVVGIWRLLSPKLGLIISSKGIEIFAIGASTKITWSEISGFSVFEVHSQKMLIIHLHNPQEYIDVGNNFRRRIAAANHKMCGSPISISSNAFSINFKQLSELCETYFQRYAVGA